MGGVHGEAADWLDWREKHPVRTEDGRWRWILPDPPSHDHPADLPKPIFDRLPGIDRCKFPWIYPDYETARFAAVLAVAQLLLDGGKLP